MNHPPRPHVHRTTDGGGTGEAGGSLVDRQFAGLQATVKAVGDMLADGSVVAARAAVRSMATALAPKALAMQANDHGPAVPYHSAIKDALVPGLPAVEDGRFFALTMPIREGLDGATHAHQAHEPGSPERRKLLEKHRKRDDGRYQPDRGIAVDLATLRAIAAGYDPESVAKATAAACAEIERQAQARAREREFGVASLRRDIEASLREASKRRRTGGEARNKRERLRARANLALSVHPIDIAAMQVEREARLADRATVDPRRDAAGKHVRTLVASMRALVDRRHGGDKAGKAVPAKRERAQAARAMATGLARHRDAIYEAWNKAPTATGGAIGYLSRSRTEDFTDEHAGRIRKAINAAHGLIVRGTHAERKDSAEGEQREAHQESMSMTELFAPIEHRFEARKRHRREALESGKAEPAKWDKLHDGVADVPSQTRRRAERLKMRAIYEAVELGTKALKSKYVREQIRRHGAVVPQRSITLNGASLILAPQHCDLTNPLAAAKTFMAGLSKPRIHPGHMKPRKSEPEKRLAHFIFSLPKKDLPPHMRTDHALLGGALSRLRLVGVDARKHDFMVFRHDDDEADGSLHLHIVFDRVRHTDGRVWDMNGIDRTVGLVGASNAMLALCVALNNEPVHMAKFEAAPVARSKKDGDGRVHHRSMSALERLADGAMRCELKEQIPDEDGEIRYRSPYRGNEDDDSADSERDLCNAKSMREALILAGRDGIMGGFCKIQDGFWNDLSQPLEKEKTTNNPSKADHWRYLEQEPRPVVGWEHLFRILAEHI